MESVADSNGFIWVDNDVAVGLTDYFQSQFHLTSHRNESLGFSLYVKHWNHWFWHQQTGFGWTKTQNLRDRQIKTSVRILCLRYKTHG